MRKSILNIISWTALITIGLSFVIMRLYYNNTEITLQGAIVISSLLGAGVWLCGRVFYAGCLIVITIYKLANSDPDRPFK